MSGEFEQVLDRRFNDFEKVMDARLKGIQDGVNEMRNTMSVIVDKYSNLPVDYVPRSEIEKDQRRTEQEMLEMKQKIEKLQTWRSYLAGGIGLLAFVIGIIVQIQWK